MLAGNDARRAYMAIWNLIHSPEESVPFLRERVGPALADPRRASELVPELNSESFAVRERAASELEGLEELAEPFLRRALTEKTSLEVRRRVGQLLQKLGGAV